MKKIFNSLSTYIAKRPKLDLVILALGIAAFLIITFINAPRASIWFDEAFSVYIAQFSFWDIARYTATDVHPPFYYWVLKVWSDLFGTTELAYRSLSIVFGAATATVAFFLSRKLFGRKVAWLALAFIVLSPMLIRYSDEARMYTLASLIVMSATYLLVKAKETGKRSYWIWYGVLVSLGMWTHYFTALAWLAHLAWYIAQQWQKGMTTKELFMTVFSKPLILTYSIAIGLFLPWLPSMIKQLTIVQSAGFWIGPVGVDTPTNYLTNFFYYLEHGKTQSWLALALITVVIIALIALPRAFKALSKKEKSSFWLIAILAVLPPVLLFIASLPPLRSSFVERYLIPAVVALSILLAVLLVKGTRKWRPMWRALPIILVLGMMISGISNVYYYGNYNKNTNVHILTRDVVRAAQDASPAGTPIIAESPWIFYEAVAYATEDHPVYFIDENTQYIYGSLDMLKDTDLNKITDLDAFEKEHPTIWYLGSNDSQDIAPYRDSWKKIETVSAKDKITGKTSYKATAYRVSAE